MYIAVQMGKQNTALLSSITVITYIVVQGAMWSWFPREKVWWMTYYGLNHGKIDTQLHSHEDEVQLVGLYGNDA